MALISKVKTFYLAHSYVLILLFLFTLFRQGPLYDLDLPYARWSMYGLGLLVVTVGIYYAVNRFFRGNYTASVLTSVILINFLFFKNLVQLGSFTNPEISFNRFGDDYFNLAATSYVVLGNVLVLTIIFLTKKTTRHMAGYLTLLTTALLLTSIGQAALELYHKKSVARVNPELTTNKLNQTTQPPDIYYFLTDGYTSHKSLEKFFNYDNSKFTNFLKQQGFYIAHQARSNYNITIASLCSSLNGSYLGVEDNQKFTPDDLRKMSSWVNNNYVVQNLKQHGYNIYHYTFFDFVNQRNAEFAIELNPGFRSFIDYTILAPFSSYLKSKSKQAQYNRLQEAEKIYTYNRYSLNFVFKHKQVLRDTRPKFFYIHTMVTHPPFVFTETGKKLQDQQQEDNPEQYPKQVAYLNKQLQKTIKFILTESANPAVIIIQGDHGSHFKGLAESQTIFNAYYFPDKNYQQLYQSISPVNTFRAVFNTYFNAQLPLLPEKHYEVYYGPK